MVGSEEDGLGEERQRGFAADESLDAYTSLQRLVFVSYGYRCALTGAQFAAPASALHPDLDVVAIQPREQGGPLTITNYLPMIASLTPAFRDGLIAIEDDYRILVPRPELLGREMLSALRARLVLPESPFRPDAAFLAYHRRYALGR
ncbi:hypothetical protein ASD04_12500 [Devosia sp. Root436]|uniref:hypothetical protein n=1 Tax=Devosia sp. Root436 TaxID=1736537 RepID=UPI0006F37AAD|nr:hypothetical protein [Devosia sp. Root436]KQX35606.1 hypothetical protein ASD04_12500 [Devosia sp. Root436]